MQITEHASLDDFKTASDPLFTRNGLESEYENVLILRILQGIADGRYTDYRLFSVKQEGKPALAAAMTPPHNLALSQGDPAALPSFSDYVKSENIPFPGINGPAALTHAFSNLWNARNRHQLTTAITLPLYIIPKVITPRTSPGHSRSATSEDLDLLVQWHVDFGTEAGLHPHECLPAPEKIARKIREESLMIWQDASGAPVSFARHAFVTQNGMTIGPVYTPPEHRGHGYASNLVAKLSQHVLDQAKWCGLFADAKNPTSNKIYQQIGYRPVFEYQEYRF